MSVYIHEEQLNE